MPLSSSPLSFDRAVTLRQRILRPSQSSHDATDSLASSRDFWAVLSEKEFRSLCKRIPNAAWESAENLGPFASKNFIWQVLNFFRYSLLKFFLLATS